MNLVLLAAALLCLGIPFLAESLMARGWDKWTRIGMFVFGFFTCAGAVVVALNGLMQW